MCHSRLGSGPCQVGPSPPRTEPGVHHQDTKMGARLRRELPAPSLQLAASKAGLGVLTPTSPFPLSPSPLGVLGVLGGSLQVSGAAAVCPQRRWHRTKPQGRPEGRPCLRNGCPVSGLRAYGSRSCSRQPTCRSRRRSQPACPRCRSCPRRPGSCPASSCRLRASSQVGRSGRTC